VSGLNFTGVTAGSDVQKAGVNNEEDDKWNRKDEKDIENSLEKSSDASDATKGVYKCAGA